MTLDEIIRNSLAEDIGDGDHTSLACIDASQESKAQLLVKDEGILAGVELAEKIFHQVDPGIRMMTFIQDGQEVRPGQVAFEVEGSAQSILTAERPVLNFMQRMSGIATKTNEYASLVRDLPVRLLDTRKTTPGLRLIEKMAVAIGGGTNHRFGLFDMIMIKDNHVDYAGGIANAIARVKTYLEDTGRDLPIEVEARNLQEVEEILEAGGIQRIMLDNFSYADMRTAVDKINGRYETEASGGITEATLREYALCGVDYISVGALTHHIKSLDLSLKAVN